MREKAVKHTRPTGLTGFWSGYYAYDMTDEAVMFTAWIQEKDGQINGTVLEESLPGVGEDEEIEAVLSGWRHGLDVRFTRRVPGVSENIDLPPHYHGDVDADCCLISGVWFFDDPSDWTGTFMMTRISGPLEARIATAESHRAGDDGESDDRA